MKNLLLLLFIVFSFNNLVAQDDYHLSVSGDPAYIYAECTNCIRFVCDCEEDDSTKSSSLKIYDIDSNLLDSKTGIDFIQYSGTFETRPYRVVYSYSTSMNGNGTYSVILDASNGNDVCIGLNSHPEEDYGVLGSLYDFSKGVVTQPNIDEYCNEEEIELKADQSCAINASYSWKVSTNGGTTFSSTGITTSRDVGTTVALSDILPDGNYTGQLQVSADVSFFNSDGGTNSGEINTIIYTINSCSPQLLDFIEKDATCSNSSDAGFDMVLDRPIGDDRKLVVSLFFEDKFNPGQYDLSTQQTTETIDEIGSTGTYSYTWPENISPGRYKVRYQTFSTDTTNPVWASLEGTEEGFTIDVPAPVEFTAVKTSEIDCVGDTGSIRITIPSTSGGQTPFQYQDNGGTWIPFTSGSIISGLSTGEHNIKVRDANECVAQDNNDDKVFEVTFLNPTSIVISGENATTNPTIITEPTGFGLSDGSIDIFVSGGTGGYSYSWTNSSTEEDLSFEVGAGNYTVVVTDSKGCTAQKTFTVGQPARLTAVISDVGSFTCNGDTVTLTSNINGGVGIYKYQWHNSSGAIGGSTGTSLTVSESGSYHLVLTDNNGTGISVTSNSKTLTEPLQVTFTALKGDDVSCYSGNDGSINLTASRGSGSYEYVISSTSLFGVTIPTTGWIAFTGGTNHTIEGRTEGNHYILVRDSNGCIGVSGVSIEKNISISEPPALVIKTGDTETYSSDTSATGVLNGAITISIAGGTSPYDYYLNGNLVGENIIAKTITRTALGEGFYTVRVVDGKSCEETLSYDLEIKAAAPLVLKEEDIQITDVTCHGGSDGSIMITPEGGTTPYTYTWSDGTINTTGVLAGVSTGDYSVTIEDDRAVLINSRIINVGESEEVSFSAIAGDFDCENNEYTINVTAVGGSEVYEYELNTDGNWISYPPNGIVNVFDGNYAIKTRDDKGCVATNTDGSDKVINFSFDKIEALRSITGTITHPKGNGLQGGSVTNIMVTGGSGTYKYSWSNGASIEEIDTLFAGEYTLTVKDDITGCEINQDFNLIDPAILEVAITETNPIICNEGLGVLTATGKGGVLITGENYSYTWYNSLDEEQGTGITLNISLAKEVLQGSYYVIVTDSNDNETTSNEGTNTNFEITQPALVTFTTTTETVPCKGGANGGIIITAEGGSGFYEYAYIKGDFGNGTLQWQSFSDPATNSTLIAVSAGNYSVQVRDSNECTGYINGSTATIDDTIIITEPEFVLAFTPASGIIITESEIGGSDGKITINVSGGTPGYTYELYKEGILDETHTTNLENHTFENLSVGNYTVEVKDANYNNATGYEGCYVTESFIIETNPVLEILDVNTLVNNISCYNGSDGSIAITPTGGDGTYTYAWEDPIGDDKGTSSSITGLSLSGLYKVTVTDGRGVHITKEISVTIPSNTTFTATIGNNVYCKDSTDGSILLSNITQDASVTDLYYVLYNDSRQEIKSELLIANSLQEYSITGLSAGTYYVKVKNSKGASYCYALNADGTEKEETIVIIEPTEGLSYSFSTENNTNPNAPGAGNGSIVLEMSGGVPFDGTEDYTVLLAGQEVLATNITITGNTITIGNLSAGSYEFTVQNGGYATAATNANMGCSITTEAIVLEDPEELIATISIEENIQCYGDLETIVLKANVTGGWREYTYEWFEVDTSTTPYQYTSLNTTTQTKDLLSAGFYTVRVTDNDGTGISVFADVADLSGPEEVTITTSSTEQLICYGVDSGEISVTASGGIISEDYTYIWEYESFTGDTSSVTTEEGKRTGLAPGTYTLTVKDDNNCSSTKAQAIFVIDALPVFEVALANKVLPGENLSNGSIELVSVIGGITPYTYQWYEKNTAGVFEAMTNRTSIKEEGLAIGDYAIIVTDAIGCTYKEEYILKIPGELILAGITEDQPISCYEGSDGILYIETEGGSGGNTYTWYDASDDTVTGTDDPYLENVSAGSYYVVVSDREGLTEQSPVYTIVSPDAITLVTSTSENISCFENTDGIIYLEALGGTENYQYRIKKDSNIYSTWQDFNDTTDAHKTTIENLDEGSYDIQMRDSNTCYYEDAISKDRIVINIPISKPARLEIVDDAIVTDITGFGLDNGTITVNVTGGISDVYEYTWNYESSITNETATVITTTGIRTDLAPGTYTLTVKDANTCEKSATYTITQPDLLEVSISQEAFIQCNGNAQATLKANVTGGVAAYTYLWFDEVGDEIGTAQNKNNLVAGDYYVYVVDSKKNEVTSTLFTVTEPEVLTTILTSTSESCGTGDDWTITSFVNGGTAPYRYNWSNGGTTASISEVAAGNYFVVIVDANGCRITENHSISVPEVLEVTATVSDLFCASSCIGTIDLDVIGGVAPYTIVWNTGATTESIKELCSGMYSVTITDQKGCEVIQEYTIEEPSGVMVDLGEDKTLCAGQSHELDIRINDVDAMYSWESDTGFSSTDSEVSLTEAGIYTATVTTGLGCIGTDTITVAISEVGIDAEFLITSQAFAEEEVIIINTSSPLSNDVEWIFPENVEIVETNTVETLTIRFDAPGAYEITLRSIEGNCFEDYTKTVIVGEAREFLDTGDSEGSSIVDFSMYPNPNSGVFTVVVDLGEAATNASLRLFSLVSNAPMDERELSGANNYESQYNMNLASGIYFLLLETAKESEIRKIVIE